jgi:hypothetical protein
MVHPHSSSWRLAPATTRSSSGTRPRARPCGRSRPYGLRRRGGLLARQQAASNHITDNSNNYRRKTNIELLFPEIGGAYLGSMSVLPLERVHDVLRTRRTMQPQYTSIQVAPSLMDVPVQIMTSYRLRQRQNSQSSQTMDVYRHSPQGSPCVAPHMPISSSATDVSSQSIHSNSPLHAPSSLPLPGTSYFPGGSGLGDVRRECSMSSIGSLGRTHSMSERTMSSGSAGHAMGMVYGPTGHRNLNTRDTHEAATNFQGPEWTTLDRFKHHTTHTEA